jgi:hypothetical protein
MKKTPKKRTPRITVRGVKFTRTAEPSQAYWGTWKSKAGTILYESKTAKVRKWHVDHPLERDRMLFGETADEALGKAHSICIEKALRDLNQAQFRYGGPML